LLNLVQNAFKALRKWDTSAEVEKRVVVSLDSFESEDLKSMVRVTVEDNGPGIPKENVEKIFIPFFTTRSRGYGIGLALLGIVFFPMLAFGDARYVGPAAATPTRA